MNFTTIEYLQAGTPRQQEAYYVLTKYAVLDKLSAFTPVLVGTVPINIDIETSDLDVICYWSNRTEFYSTVIDSFGNERAFHIRECIEPDYEVVIATFWLDDFELEIFGQNIPTQQQMGYRHMLIEHKLLTERGEPFRREIIALKRQGYKTEPAFGKLLGLGVNPYLDLLTYEDD